MGFVWNMAALGGTVASMAERLEAAAFARLTQAALDLDLAAEYYSATGSPITAAALRQTAAEVRAASVRLSR